MYQIRQFVLAGILIVFGTLPSIAEEVRPPCPSCRCLEQVGSVVFAPGQLDLSVDALSDRLPDCLWTQESYVFGKTQPLIFGARNRYEEIRSVAPIRRICEATWAHMVDFIETEITKSCAPDLPADAPAVLKELAARCDQDDLITTRTIIDQDSFLSGLEQDSEAMACPVAKDAHILLWVITRRDNAVFTTNGHIFDRLESFIQNYPSALFPFAHILQHADQNRPLQKQGLKHLTELYEKGVIGGRHVARLTDDILNNEKNTQRYGTFFTCRDGETIPNPPLEDPENVDRIRAEMGLSTLAEKIADYGSRCKN